jgi:hypothetical protein
VASGDRRPDDRLGADASVRDPGRAGRALPFPGLGRAVLHHRDATAGGRRQSGEGAPSTRSHVYNTAIGRTGRRLRFGSSATLAAAQRALAAAIGGNCSMSTSASRSRTGRPPALAGQDGPRSAAMHPDRPGQGLLGRLVRRPARQRLVAPARVGTRAAPRHRQDRSPRRVPGRHPARGRGTLARLASTGDRANRTHGVECGVGVRCARPVKFCARHVKTGRSMGCSLIRVPFSETEAGHDNHD